MNKAVVFDIDDTLTATTAANRAARKACLELITSGLGKTPDARTEALESRLYQVFGWSRLPDLWRALALEAGQENPSEETIEQALELFDKTFFNNFRLLPTVESTLSKLHALGAPMGIISDGDESLQRRKMEQTGIDRYFEPERVIVTIQSDIYSSKPSTRNFLRMEKILGIGAKKSIYVGDKPWDIAAANVAGWTSVRTRQALVGEPDSWPDGKLNIYIPDYVVEKCSEIMECL